MYKNTLTASIVLSVALMGCASNTVTPQQYSGFLSDYSKLQEAQSPSGQPVMRWVSPSLKAGQYSNVMLAPTVFYPAAKASEQVSANTLSQIPTQFDQELRTAVQASGMQVVNMPGPNTLKLRPAITAVNTSNAPLAAYQYIPIALVTTGAMAAMGEHDQQVTVMVEMDVSDAQTGAPIAQAVRKSTGSDLPNTHTQLAAKDIQPALKTWASDLSSQLHKLK